MPPKTATKVGFPLPATGYCNGDIVRLSQQLADYKVVKQHVQMHTIDELQFYPTHDKRRETREYQAIHEKMVKEKDLPCLVCGVKYSTLHDPKENPYGATQIETHHHIVEWALQDAIDVGKFNKTLRPHLAYRHPNDPVWKYETLFDEKKVRDWVDHSEHNLWVLCNIHHRAQFLGIHEVTYPIWSPMNLLRDDFEEWARKEMEEIKKRPKAA
jgi:hypothetical protein